MNSESPQMIERELKSLRETAARLAKAGDWLNACAIYHVALDEAGSASRAPVSKNACVRTCKPQ